MKTIVTTVVFLGITLICIDGFAHGGRLNSEGCHNNRKTGGYHCHRTNYVRPATKKKKTRRKKTRTSKRPRAVFVTESPRKKAVNTLAMCPVHKKAKRIQSKDINTYITNLGTADVKCTYKDGTKELIWYSSLKCPPLVVKFDDKGVYFVTKAIGYTPLSKPRWLVKTIQQKHCSALLK